MLRFKFSGKITLTPIITVILVKLLVTSLKIVEIPFIKMANCVFFNSKLHATVCEIFQFYLVSLFSVEYDCSV